MTSPTAEPSPVPGHADVLVVGAGPAGAAAAAYAARSGAHVVLADAAVFPRDKTCGDGLTPRAVAALDRLGMGDLLHDRPRIEGLELHGWGRDQRVPWPSGRFPAYGSAIARLDFDDAVRRFALDQGAESVSGAKAVDAELSGGRVRSVTFQHGCGYATVRAEQVIVADGVRSGLGKILGREWHRDTAYGVAARSYAHSRRSDHPWMGSHLELRDEAGTLLPGYGWVFPLGDGRVNVGVGALATAKRPASMALKPILAHYARMVGAEWELTGEPTGIASALLPMGGAVSGIAGPNWMLIGDAAACVNPLNGEGIDYALETARLATDLLAGSDDHTRAWPALLTAEYGPAFAAARRVAAMLTVPQSVPLLGRPGIRSQRLMSLVVRVMGNLITPDDADLVARAWRGAGAVATRFDDRPPFT